MNSFGSFLNLAKQVYTLGNKTFFRQRSAGTFEAPLMFLGRTCKDSRSFHGKVNQEFQKMKNCLWQCVIHQIKEETLNFNVQRLSITSRKKLREFEIKWLCVSWISQKVRNFNILVGSSNLDLIKSSYFSMIRHPLIL